MAHASTAHNPTGAAQTALRFPLSGLRLQLLILVLIAIVPTAGLGVYMSISEEREAARGVQQETLDFVRLVAARESEQITVIRELISLFALTDAVRVDPAGCTALAAKIVVQSPYYANVGAADLHGDVYCSAVPLQAPVNVSDRTWFKGALKAQGFSAGDYQIGRITHRGTQNFGYPIFDQSGALRGVAYLALDLGWFAQVAEAAHLAAGSEFVVVDHHGAILTRHPDADKWTGRTLPDSPLRRALGGGLREGTVVGSGEDRIRRVYAYAPLSPTPDAGGAFVAVGVPTGVAFADANRRLATTLVLVLLAAGTALGVALTGAERFIFRGVKALLGATARLSIGDLSARVGPSYVKGELGTLAGAFDEMAETLEIRAAEAAKAEAALRHSERRFRALIEHSSDVTVLTRSDGTITYASPSITRVLGYAGERLVGESTFAFLHPDDAGRIRGIFTRLMQDPGGETAAQFRARHHDGSWRWMDAVAMNLIKNPDVQAVVGHFWDITKRKEAEETVRHRAADLEVLHEIAHSLRRARSIDEMYDTLVDRTMSHFEAVHGSLALLSDDRSTFTRVSTKGIATEAVGSTFPAAGSRSGRVVASNVPFVTGDFATEVVPRPWMLPEAYQQLGPFALVAVRSEENTLGTLVVARPKAPDGRLFTAEDVRLLETIAETAGSAIRRAQLFADLQRHAAELERRVTERTAALTSAKEEADRANHAKSEFLSRMSHELRTPLNAVLGFAQLLEMDSLNGAQRESVGYIVRGGQHLLTLINDVLDITRIEAGRLGISLEPVALGPVVRETLDLMRPVAAETEAALTGGVDPACQGYALADSGRLKQILLNLVGNAIKYGGRRVAVTVTCTDVAGGRVRVAVADTGPGIALDKAARLFTPFDRLGSEHTDIEGTGLGLALSKALAEAMGGTLGVETAPDRGSVFFVELPAAQNPAAPAGSRTGAEAAEPAASGVGADRAMTVLYVEDNLSNVELVKRVLSQRPHVRLLPTMQGRLGLDLARRHRPDVILLDLHLPDLQGDEVLRRLKETPETRAIPVIMISADATAGQAARLLAAGARAYLTKPLEVKEFLALIDEYVNAPEVRHGTG